MTTNENTVELATLEWLAELGYTTIHGNFISPESSTPERTSYGQIILTDRFEKALARLNPHLPLEAHKDAFKALLHSETPNLLQENRRLHKALTEGVPVEYVGKDGARHGDSVKLINFENPLLNDWLVVNQFTVIESAPGKDTANRRPDMVIFINGLPLAVIELKNPGDKNATLVGAFNQLQTYKAQIPSLFRLNQMLVISDGISARIGSLTADVERFMPWRTIEGDSIEPKGSAELGTLIKGVFEKNRFLKLIKDFIVFGDSGNDTIKILAGYHQFHAVIKAVDSTLRATAPNVPDDASVTEDPSVYGLPGIANQIKGDRRVGVIWHTQGSGKSLLMAFYAGMIIKHPKMENPTVVVLTDRNDLDDQLFSTFSMCHDLLRQTPEQAQSRSNLKILLDRPSGGVIFTTIQKFTPERGESQNQSLTNRRNVIVIADEAHRTQYGFSAKVDSATGKYSYGFAKYMRDAMPNASFIGFTGTPIESADVNTPVVFGGYIDIYDISRAVEDGATVPIYYESRLARVELNEDEKTSLDAEIEEIIDEAESTEEERLKRKWSSVEAVVGAEKRLTQIADDLVKHFEDRVSAIDGKAMIVCMSRRICVALYKELIAIRPDWHSDDEKLGKIKIVMTGAASDPLEWQTHIGIRPKQRRELIARRAKDAQDSLQLVIVQSMWLTGFDAPAMHTMYIDKPMRGHGLMQAIARVNRVFKDKPGGLVVDYIGIAQNLKNALGDFSRPNQHDTGGDLSDFIAVLQEKFEIVQSMFYGFDYQTALQGTSQERLSVMAAAIEWVLNLQQNDAAREQNEDAKKRVHKRYFDAVLELSKAFALASSTDYAREIREEVGFFQAIRSALIKSVPTGKKGIADRDLAIQQIVSRAVISTEIVDIMKAAGIESPDISILSDDFLAEIKEFDKKNLALEALRKLINGEISSKARKNVVQSKAFSERLESAIARYHANALTTVEVLEELIKLAKDIRAARQRGEEMGLSSDEEAFYDALAENNSAREMMGDEKLRVIAHELVTSVRGNITVDWIHRESARARMRVLVKKILRKYGYPPDLQNSAVMTVLQQAEALSAEWA
jgi:type I restriction enzyme, R subunit